MAQLHFTLDYDFFVGLFSETKDDAFGKLMEAMLNQVLKAESAEQLNAGNYERSGNRLDYRNRTRERSLTTSIGKNELQFPRHRNVQKVTEELCGETFSKSTVSEICKELDIPVKQFKDRLIPDHYPFIIVDAIYLKAREDHRIRSKALFVAIAVNNTGHKEVIGFEVYDAEKTSTWKSFFESLKSRGLRDVDIVISDAHSGLRDAIKECFTGSSWQRCQAHFMRNILDKCPKKYSAGPASELKDMFNASTMEEARRLEKNIYDEYNDVAEDAMSILDEGFEDSMTIMVLPSKYRVSLRTSNIIEHQNREIRRREKAIQIFPITDSIIRLMGALLMDDHNDWSTRQRLFDMKEYFDKQAIIQSKLQRSNVA